VKCRDIEARLRAAGWRPARHGRRHDIWTDGEREVAIPRHVEINEHTAKAILKEARGDK
jgi:hypothetical protein